MQVRHELVALAIDMFSGHSTPRPKHPFWIQGRAGQAVGVVVSVKYNAFKTLSIPACNSGDCIVLLSLFFPFCNSRMFTLLQSL